MQYEYPLILALFCQETIQLLILWRLLEYRTSAFRWIPIYQNIHLFTLYPLTTYPVMLSFLWQWRCYSFIDFSKFMQTTIRYKDKHTNMWLSVIRQTNSLTLEKLTNLNTTSMIFLPSNWWGNRLQNLWIQIHILKSTWLKGY